MTTAAFDFTPLQTRPPVAVLRQPEPRINQSAGGHAAEACKKSFGVPA